MKYSTVLADPPWQESGGGKIKRGADRHYPLMSIEAICALPVSALAEPNAHLYLWATNNFLERAFEVIKAWGFRYVTCVTWGKYDFVTGKMNVGLGQYFRGSSEQLLFAVRGRVPYRINPETQKRAQGRTLVLEPRGEHSAKPAVFRRIIERVSPGPYLELFARERVPGWDAWGNEVESSVTINEGPCTPRVDPESGTNTLRAVAESPTEAPPAADGLASPSKAL